MFCVCVVLCITRYDMTQGGGASGPSGGDAKAVGLMAEMEKGDWGQGRLTEADRIGNYW